ncbi:YafY family transcriptional regulator [Lactiplantibacillus garii]|uniref:YafY family transcriptional regulator n=1 Tax=Lactiplantibacillus garii TaxID=2306423 RepID=A0A3R8J611_9LACO|nr:YafY family protein [Lactiplantibacillus garii]RRK09747.1 YafY family transcriptional regulator [Lactiplantibacillus garii]
MKAEKLLKMIYLLLENQQLAAPVLAERLDVSVRTIYRYVDTLSTAGFPVYATKGRNGGIALLPEFKLNSTVVNADEQVNILAALQTLQTLRVDDGMALDKLAAIFNRHPVAWLQIDPTAWGGAAAHQREWVERLRDAILQERFVTFGYLNSRNQRGQRLVYPYRVLFKDHAWYVEGYAVERRAPRLFKLSRIENLRAAPTPGDPQRPWLKAQPTGMAPTKQMTVKLRLAAALQYRISENFPADQVAPQADGSFIITSQFTDSDWLLTFLLSFGAGLEVLAPQSLRKRVRAELQKMLAHY